MLPGMHKMLPGRKECYLAEKAEEIIIWQKKLGR